MKDLYKWHHQKLWTVLADAVVSTAGFVLVSVFAPDKVAEVTKLIGYWQPVIAAVIAAFTYEDIQRMKSRVVPNDQNILKSGKFWTAIADAIVSTVVIVLTSILSPKAMTQVMTLIGYWQPVIAALIAAVTYVDVQRTYRAEKSLGGEAMETKEGGAQ